MNVKEEFAYFENKLKKYNLQFQTHPSFPVVCPKAKTTIKCCLETYLSSLHIGCLNNTDSLEPSEWSKLVALEEQLGCTSYLAEIASHPLYQQHVTNKTVTPSPIMQELLKEISFPCQELAQKKNLYLKH